MKKSRGLRMRRKKKPKIDIYKDRWRSKTVKEFINWDEFNKKEEDKNGNKIEIE